jgi:hypothetical protein
VSTSFFIAAGIFAIALVGLLVWALHRPRHRRRRAKEGLSVLRSAPQHLCSMGSIRQAFDPEDLKYVQDRAGSTLAKQVAKERRQVAFLYLAAIRRDFEDLLQLARVVALLSPEVSGVHEYERLRLTMVFRARFQLLRLRFLAGYLALPELGALGEMVTTLAVQMETAMAELGERAALAAELALESDR